MNPLMLVWVSLRSWFPPRKNQTPQVQEPNAVAGKANASEELYLAIPNYGRQLPMKSPKILMNFVNANRSIVSNYVLACLQNAIVEDRAEVVLFKLGESRLIAKVTQPEYEATLRMLDAEFLKAEEYEKVQQCRQLMNRVHVNRVIDESRQR